MKKNLMLLSVILIGMWSCDEKENMDPVGNWELAPATLSTPAANANIDLNAVAPSSKVRFEWEAASASNGFVVSYSVSLLPQGSASPEEAVLTLIPGNGGRNRFVEATAEAIDYALWSHCYSAGATVDLVWTVSAQAIETIATASQPLTVKRFETDPVPTSLFVYGEATEAGGDVSNATAMRARTNGDDEPTGIFDVYMSLTEGKTYHFTDQLSGNGITMGGEEGTLSCGTSATAPETGVYRIVVDWNEGTFALLKIEKWSLVGDAVEGGWGGDVPLTYQGGGIWKGEIEFYQPYETAGFIFRANGDWGYIIKRIKGTALPNNKGGDVLMESEAGAAGVEVEDLPTTLGLHTVTLDLSADGYTYVLEPLNVSGPVETIIGKSNNPEADAVSGSFDFGTYEIPDALYLVSGGALVATLVKDGDVFRSQKYVALQASDTYVLSDQQDGTGQIFNEFGDGTIAVDHDQAYQINVDFAQGKVLWKHYNLKLFHWDEDGGGWDQRQELLMTYSHPYTYEVTGDLTAGYHSKFNSPWEVQFGTDATGLAGTMTNGGPNFKGITSSGTYTATIVVSDDYATGEYTFVKQ